jgi:hypothetical protein
MDSPFFWLRRILPQRQKSSINTPQEPGLVASKLESCIDYTNDFQGIFAVDRNGWSAAHQNAGRIC